MWASMRMESLLQARDGPAFRAAVWVCNSRESVIITAARGRSRALLGGRGRLPVQSRPASARICPPFCRFDPYFLIAAPLARFRAFRPGTRAILFMMVMVVCFSILETTAKYLSRSYPVPMLVWCRYAVHTLLMVILLAPRMGMRLVRTGQQGGQTLRAALLMGSTLFNFSALSFLPMAEVKAISFVSPLLVTLLAVWLLSEHVSGPRWIAVGAGFCGVLFIVRPGSAMLQWPALFALGSASCYTVYQVMNRKFHESADPIAKLLYTPPVRLG